MSLRRHYLGVESSPSNGSGFLIAIFKSAFLQNFTCLISVSEKFYSKSSIHAAGHKKCCLYKAKWALKEPRVTKFFERRQPGYSSVHVRRHLNIQFEASSSFNAIKVFMPPFPSGKFQQESLQTASETAGRIHRPAPFVPSMSDEPAPEPAKIAYVLIRMFFGLKDFTSCHSSL